MRLQTLKTYRTLSKLIIQMKSQFNELVFQTVSTLRGSYGQGEDQRLPAAIFSAHVGNKQAPMTCPFAFRWSWGAAFSARLLPQKGSCGMSIYLGRSWWSVVKSSLKGPWLQVLGYRSLRGDFAEILLPLLLPGYSRLYLLHWFPTPHTARSLLPAYLFIVHRQL